MKSFNFLVHNIFYIGGTTRSVINLANTLSRKGHAVTITSVFRNQQQPAFPVDDAIHIDVIIDYTKKHAVLPLIMNRVRKYTPLLTPKIIQPYEPGMEQFSSFIENKIIKAIRHMTSDYIVGTRATYNLLIAKYAQRTTIGMEHMHFNAHTAGLQQLITTQYPQLDYITTLTPYDESIYQTIVPKEHVVLLPNIIDIHVPNAMHKERRITALGRLEHEKGYDLLIDSIRFIQHELRTLSYTVSIYGEGSEKTALQQMIDRHKLNDIIQLQPSTHDIAGVLAHSMITVIPSRSEGFGMVILEAMAYQNLVVSFNADIGPKWLLNDDNAYIAQVEDITELGQQILAAIHDDHRQDKLKHGDLLVAQFHPDAIYNKLKSQIPL